MKHGVYTILLRLGVSYCTRCGHVLPLDAFHKDPSRAHGLNFYCAQCKAGFRNGLFRAVLPIPRPRVAWHCTIMGDLQWALERNGLAYCSKCDSIRPRSDFFVDASRRANRHGLQSHCKACHMEYASTSR